MTPDNPIWVEFARSMAAMVAPVGPRYRAVAGDQTRLVVFWISPPAMDCLALRWRRNFLRRTSWLWIGRRFWRSRRRMHAKPASRAGTRQLPGSAFEVDFGTDYDVILVTNFFHHFDPPTCEQLMAKIHSALTPGGRCVTLDFVPNDDRVSPPISATFAMTMLASTPAGDAYTFAEYERMFRAAGIRAGTKFTLVPMSPETSSSASPDY